MVYACSVHASSCMSGSAACASPGSMHVNLRKRLAGSFESAVQSCMEAYYIVQEAMQKLVLYRLRGIPGRSAFSLFYWDP